MRGQRGVKTVALLGSLRTRSVKVGFGAAQFTTYIVALLIFEFISGCCVQIVYLQIVLLMLQPILNAIPSSSI